MNRELTVELAERRYPIRIGKGLLEVADSYAVAQGRRCFLLTDETVAGAAGDVTHLRAVDQE